MTTFKQITIKGYFVLSFAVALLAVTPAAWSTVRSEVNQLQDFLQSHPKISTELRANPNLVNNKRYLDKHDDLAKFMKRHPEAKRELVNHPSRVFGNYYRKQAHVSHHR
jgi:mRNA-degrading endonuclease HigB of HigAB toxin-antitoxin module